VHNASRSIEDGDFQRANIANAQAAEGHAMIAAQLLKEERLAHIHSPLREAYYWAVRANLEAGEAAMTADSMNGLYQAQAAAFRAQGAATLAQQWAYRAQWDARARQWAQWWRQSGRQWERWESFVHGFLGLGSR
jgi:hypothetical protein